MKTFIFLNFMVSLFSDIVLNDIASSGKYDSINTLKPYFKNKYVLEAGVYAGLTVISCLIVVLILSQKIFNFYIPNTFNQLINFLLIAYPLGYYYDYLIYKHKIFGDSLDEYYQKLGVGHWGALAFSFSIIISFILQKYFIRLI